MILVTGAAGKTGRAVIRALADKGWPVRALVRREAQRDSVTAAGAQAVVIGDMGEMAGLRQAMDGARAVYHICPNVHPEEVAIGRAAIAAAGQAGVEHFVYHSVLHPQTEAMPHHWNKLRVEEVLFESGIPSTILQPAPYMQNLLAGWDAILQRGAYAVPYPPQTRLSLVDVTDVAAAAAIVLSQPGHAGATYELCGTEALTQVRVAATLSDGLGRPVRAEQVPINTWEKNARVAGLGEYAIQTLIKMFRYYERHGLSGSPNVLRWLLGREPATLVDFVAQTRQGWGRAT